MTSEPLGEMRRGGKEGRRSGPAGAVKRRNTAGVNVWKGRNRSQYGEEANHQIAGGPSGIELPGGLLSTYHPDDKVRWTCEADVELGHSVYGCVVVGTCRVASPA